MRVTFLRDFRSWRRGETVCASPITARAWLDAGIGADDGHHAARGGRVMART